MFGGNFSFVELYTFQKYYSNFHNFPIFSVVFFLSTTVPSQEILISQKCRNNDLLNKIKISNNNNNRHNISRLYVLPSSKLRKNIQIAKKGKKIMWKRERKAKVAL